MTISYEHAVIGFIFIICITGTFGFEILTEAFRAPAIPLWTTDPFTQTWIRGDSSTGLPVTHWDGTSKSTNVLMRVDNDTSYQLLGVCAYEEPTKPGPSKALPPGQDISPGSCDIANYPSVSEDACNMMCYGSQDCEAYVIHSGTCYLKSCTQPIVANPACQSNVIDVTAKICQNGTLLAKTLHTHIWPTRTIFELQAGDDIFVNMTFLSTMFTDDHLRLSRPVYYLDLNVFSPSPVQMYVDLSAEHTVNSVDQKVGWSEFGNSQQKGQATVATAQGWKIGRSEQNILGNSLH